MRMWLVVVSLATVMAALPFEAAAPGPLLERLDVERFHSSAGKLMGVDDDHGLDVLAGVNAAGLFVPIQVGGRLVPIRGPYLGNCRCPYDLIGLAERCGDRSLWVSPQGPAPQCYF